MNLPEKRSPGTYKRMESSGPKVQSRYLRGPTGSCHDQCKCMITTQPTGPRTINLFAKRIPKPPTDRRIIEADHSVNRIKKAPSDLPKSPTRTTNVKNNKFVKNEGLKRDIFKSSTKKDVAIEPKSRDSKPKTQISRTSRRHSDVFQTVESEPVVPLRVPRRRLSDVGSVSNASMVRGSSNSKNESRKDSKLPSLMNKKSNNSSQIKKTIMSSPKPVAKVPSPLRSFRSLPKPELIKGSRRLINPTKTKVGPEKTLNVIGRTKSQIPISSTSSSPSSSVEKVIAFNELLESCPPSVKDKIVDLEDKNAKEAGKLVVETIENENQIPISSASSSSSSSEEKVIACNGVQESCSPSMEDRIEDLEDKSSKEDGKLVVETIENQIPISSTSSLSSEEKVIACNELQESCSPSMEDNTHTTDGQNDDKIADSEDKNTKEDGKLMVETMENQIPISSASSSPSSSEEKVTTCNGLQECSPSMEDNVSSTVVQYNDNISDLKDNKESEEVEKLAVETTESQIPISSSSSSPSSSEEKVVTCNELQESCSPSIEDNTPATTDGQNDYKIADSSENKESEEVEKLAVETTESQIPISPASSSSEEKVVTSNGLQECSPSIEDDIPETDDPYNDKISDSEDKDVKDEVGKLVVETTESQIPISPASSSSSSEEQVVTSNGLQESSPSIEDNIPETDDPYNDKISDSEDKDVKDEVGNLVVETTESQILPISTEENEVICPPLTEDDGQNDDTIEDSEERATKELNRVGKLMVETEDLSLDELKFRRGKVISPQSENSSPRKLQFRDGNELEENENEKVEKVTLRRVSSDGAVVISPEISPSINVDLKHQEVVEKKDLPGSLNKVIEETASKLIQARKSKVKALVGAFETVTW